MDGKLSHVARSTLEPIILQAGQKVPLANLSSGNLYLIQRMVSLLGRMYSVHVLRQTPPEEMCATPGLLLIDEAENHLHPKWQKIFLRRILEVFPNLQIIATTHSPFIISSVSDARVFVCSSKLDRCEVRDESGAYANLPVEELLVSPVFGGTHGFGKEISELLDQRKRAIEAREIAERERIEARLQVLNPDYFAYLDLHRKLDEIPVGKNE